MRCYKTKIRLRSLSPELLEEVNTKVAGMCKIIKNAANTDHSRKKAIKSPLAFNSALSLEMAADRGGLKKSPR